MVGAGQRKMSRTRQCGGRGRERESKGVPVKLFNKSSSVPVYPMIVSSRHPSNVRYLD